MGLNAKQVEQLLRGINPKRVLHTRGQAHLAGWDVEAHLTRIFGFEGWDKKVRSIELVFEDGVKRGDRVGWYVTYRCLMTLVIKDPHGNVIREIDDGATGSAENQPQRGEAHDLAYKNAITYALKRCAKDLGDQFGLSLYNGGSTNAIVGRVLNLGSDGDVESATPDEVHPDTEPGTESTGEWADEAEAKASGLTSKDDATALYEETNGKFRAGEITGEQRSHICNLIIARMDDLSHEAPAVTTATAPDGDPWLAKIEEITSEEDAAKVREELDAAHRGGLVDSRRHKALGVAIRTRLNGLKVTA